jgi:hypothetical protein
MNNYYLSEQLAFQRVSEAQRRSRRHAPAGPKPEDGKRIVHSATSSRLQPRGYAHTLRLGRLVVMW